MKREDIEGVVYEVLIDIIAEKVKDKLISQGKKLLVVFTGAALGFSEALKELKKLRDKGFILNYIFSDMALEVFTLDKIRDFLGEDMTILNKGKSSELLLESYDGIVVPTMTINTMAKISLGIMDSSVSRILLTALMKGKLTIIAVDGCCPDNKAREELGYRMNSALKETLRENMRKVSDYGARLTTADKLAATVIKKVRGDFFNGEVMSNLNKSEKNEIYIDKRVIGYQDIMSNRSYKVIKISEASLVTQMAEEAVKSHSIELRWIRAKE